MMKKRILWYSDSPECITGFGGVAKNLLKWLCPEGKYHLTVLGINFDGHPYSQEDYPYLKPDKTSPLDGLWPAAQGQDVYGMNKFIEFVRRGEYDAVFVLQDPFIMGAVLPHILKIREEMKKHFKIIFYFPIDVTPKKDWVDDVIAKVDFPVVYTQYGENEIFKVSGALEHLKVIHHGTDTKTFFPIIGQAKQAIRALLFPAHVNDFIVLNVNRNQLRKDLNRTFAAFALFHKKNPKSFLFVHAAKEDVGGNMEEMAGFYGLRLGIDWSCPDPKMFNTIQGVPVEIVNQLYNAVDLVVSTTLGEGWGLSLTEAMACKTPVLFPRNTSIEEIIGQNEERGTFIRCGDIDHTIALGSQDNGRVRPMVHVQDMVDKMTNIMRYPGKYKKRAEKAYEWVQERTWEILASQWEEVFSEALKETKDDHSVENPGQSTDPSNP